MVESHDAYRVHPSWEVLRADGTSGSIPTGAKRSFDAYAVDDFFSDVKKRRVNPSYDNSTSLFLLCPSNLRTSSHVPKDWVWCGSWYWYTHCICLI
jgi:hypothetical protein